MSCSRYVEWIAARLEGSLAEQAERELEGHLAACDRCRAELLLQSGIIASLAETAPSGLTEDFTRRVTERVRIADRAARRHVGWGSLVPAAALAVGIMLAFVFRFQIDRFLPPAVEGLVGRIAGPLAYFGEGTVALLGSLPEVAGDNVWTEWIQSVAANTLAMSAAACLAVLWALSRVHSYLRA